MPYIYVLGMDGKPQMPTTRRRHVQRLLDTGRARIASHVPFTIQLLFKSREKKALTGFFLLGFFSDNILLVIIIIDERSLYMEILKVWEFLNIHFFTPVSDGAKALWTQVLSPFCSAFSDWIQNYIPGSVSFADFCTNLFKLKYQGRIYSFMLLFPIAVFIFLLSLLTKKRRRHAKFKNKKRGA